MSDSLVRATGAVYRRAWRQAVFAALVAGGAWLGHYAGLPGVALGVLGAIAINFLLMAHLSLSLAGVTWRTLWDAHRPALAVTALFGAEAWGLATFLRLWNVPAPLVLLGCLLAGLGTAGLLLRCAPRFTLGADGVWMLRTLSSYLPGRINPLHRLGVGVE